MSSAREEQEMSLERLRALVDSYGGNLARIPDAERVRVKEFLERSELARELWQEAAQLDDLLAAPPATLAPSAALMQRLRAIPGGEPWVGRDPAREQDNVVHLPRRARAWASVAAAAALFLGVFTGAQGDDDTPNASDHLAQVEASDDAATLSEFGALALGSELVTDLEVFEGELE
jgi:hypothetical protein